MPTAAELREQLMRRAQASGAPTGSPNLHISSKGPVGPGTHMSQLSTEIDEPFDADLDMINSLIPPADTSGSVSTSTASVGDINPFAAQPSPSPAPVPQPPNQSANAFAQNASPVTSSDDLGEMFGQDQEFSEDSDDMKTKLIIGGVISVIVLILIIMFVGQRTKDQQVVVSTSQGSSGSINVVQGSILSGSNPIVNDTLAFSDEVYTDSIQISKFITLEDNTVHCYFKGTLTNYGKAVVFEVSAKDYNRYANSSVIDVAYRIARFDNTTYCLNFEIQG